MITQVIYRKWRPRIFNDLVGQEHVTTVLKQAVKQARTSHAYLFAGPRGTGKTSMARVLARTLNCLDPEQKDSTNVCKQCQKLDQGRALDLIEMDAASNRGIDEIRSIRDKVNFLPVEARYKIYIVDEAHMLTEAASNAFLKTLEEPPPHVIFILCTTEAHKILPTITSRCQRFDFRRLPSDVIVNRLKFLSEEEKVHINSECLSVLARAASGSLRDAENLLEQTMVSFGDTVTLEDLRAMLGLVHNQLSQDLITYLLMDNTSSALNVIGRASHEGVDIRLIHRQSVELLRAVLMIQSGAIDTLDMDNKTLHDMEILAGKVPIAKVMSSLRALGNIRVKLDSVDTLPLELAVVESSFTDIAGTGHGLASAQVSSVNIKRTTVGNEAGPDHQQNEADITTQSHNGTNTKESHNENLIPFKTPTSESDTRPEIQDSGDQMPIDIWTQVVQTLRRHKGRRFFLGALLKDCKTPHLENDTVVLPFNHRSNMERMASELEEITNREALEKTFHKFLGKTYEIKLTLNEDTSQLHSSANSPLVRAARLMGGRILEERKIGETNK